MNDIKSYKGSCICGAVKILVTGRPEGSGYCHCDSCRHWSASPMSAFTLWKQEDVKILTGEEYIDAYNKTQQSTRKWCTLCGGHILIDHPEIGLVDVPAAVISSFPFKPELHVNYGEAVIHIKDGLKKLKDVPKELGGTGIEIEE